MNPLKITADARLVLAPGYRFQWEPAQDCYVLLYPEGMVKLNFSGGEILKRICQQQNQQKQTVSQLISNLKTAFPGAELENDVYQFLEEAYSNDWICKE